VAIVKKDESARRATRVPVDLRGSLRHGTAWDVVVQDLSLTGCLLQCPTGVDGGAIVDLSLDLGTTRLGAKARVVDVSIDGSALPAASRYLVGLEFLGLPVREEADLRSFLEREARRRGLRAVV
jgi:PilZ domain-containing protein